MALDKSAGTQPKAEIRPRKSPVHTSFLGGQALFRDEKVTSANPAISANNGVRKAMKTAAISIRPSQVRSRQPQGAPLVI
jgi:hypothetical protein